MKNKLLVSAIITPDGTRLESLHRHDYKTHTDANGEQYMLDGGIDYVRRSVNKEPATPAFVYTNDPHEKIRTVFKWGTRGKDGKEELQWRTLDSLSSEHVQAILNTQHHRAEDIRKVFEDELDFRKQ
jgi:hypothetical protein